MPAVAVTAVSTSLDTLTATAHGLLTGDRFRLRNVGGALPASTPSLAGVTDYFAVRVDADNIKVATSSANALAGTPVVVDITGSGSGTTTIEYGLPYTIPNAVYVNGVSQVQDKDLNTTFTSLVAIYDLLTGQPQSLIDSPTVAGNLTVGGALLPFSDFTFSADATTNICTATNHPLHTGAGPIQTSNAGGGLPGGLAAATPYFAINVSSSTFKLATSQANALAGVEIDITSNGTGTQTINHQATTSRVSDATVTRNLTVFGNITEHGKRTINLPIRFEHSTTASSGTTLSGSGDKLLVGIPLNLGDRILGARARIQDSATGPTKLQMELETFTVFTGLSNTIATSAASSGTGSVQTITLSGLTTTIVTQTSYFIMIRFNTGTSNSIIGNIEVDYDHP